VTRFDPETENNHRWPHFLPGARQFLFSMRTRTAGQAEIDRLMLGSLDSTDATLLIDDATNAAYVEPGYVLYARAGNLYAWRFDAGSRRLIGQPVPVVEEKLSLWAPKGLAVFAASDSGTLVYLPEAVPKTTLQWYDASGRALGSLGKAGFYRTPRVSPDGKKVAFSLAESNPELTDLWVLDLQYERPIRITLQSGRYLEPAWSRDSGRLVFGCQPKGVQDLCVRSLLGGADTELLHASPNWKISPSWMPDGKSIVFSEQDPATGYDINAVSVGGEPAPRTLLKTPFSETSPEVSPDGRWIAYLSDETGRAEVNIRPVSGSLEQWQVSTGGGTRARWRGDGRELYFASPDGFVMAVSVETQPVFRPGTPRRLFQLPERPYRTLPIFEDVSPDGGRFLLNVPVVARSSVGFHVIANWRALLDAHGE
jgi:hypothetical protein